MSTVPESLRTYRIDLVTAIDRELARPHSNRQPLRFRWRGLSAAVAVAAVALLALAVAEPWHGSPTVLDRAQAALLAPVGGKVLYESITVQAVPSASRSVRSVQLWIDSAPPHRFRMTFVGPRPAEVGGTLGSSTGWNYVAAGNRLYRAAFLFRIGQSDLDPAAFIRSALASGRAKLLGKTSIRGRDVIKIQLSTWFNGTRARILAPIALYYVDADTYRPVRIVTPPPRGRVALLPANASRADFVGPEDLNGGRLGFAEDPSAFLVGFPGYSAPTLPGIPWKPAVGTRPYFIYDFGDYRLVPASPANRKLASVRAMRDDIAGYTSGFRAASTPLFEGLDSYDSDICFLGLVHGLERCARAIADVRAALPPLLRYVTGHKPPASSLQWTNADLRRLEVTLRGLQQRFAGLSALIASGDFVNPTRYTGSIPAFYKAIFELQVDIPELRLPL